MVILELVCTTAPIWNATAYPVAPQAGSRSGKVLSYWGGFCRVLDTWQP